MGLKALADHMNSGTMSMSNESNPDLSRAVMRTYSSYGRSKPGGGGGDQLPQGQVPHHQDDEPGEPEGAGVLKHPLQRGHMPTL